MKLVDANVMLYAVHREAEQHVPALAWLDRTMSSTDTVLLPWVSLIAFVRLSTHPAVYERPQSVADAFANVQAWLEPAIVITDQPDVHHPRIMAELLEAAGGHGGNLVTDAHLAALAVQYDATVVSYDDDFGRFPGVRWERPQPPQVN